jgi:hypothetical protein
MDRFSRDDAPLTAFLDEALWEEMQTSRCWIFLDYPYIENPEDLDVEEAKLVKPYPIIQKAENVINWRIGHSASGKAALTQVIVRGFEEVFEEDDEFHPKLYETCWVHEIGPEGYYQVRVFQERGQRQEDLHTNNTTNIKDKTGDLAGMVLKDTFDNILMHGERMTEIPAWPLNGSLTPMQPLLSAVVDKEVSLYNKISRRNHLLYGAATYTPIISSDLTDEEFDDIVEAGLGSWIRLRQGDSASILDTPTAALSDMDRAITGSIEEIAKLGVRMLSPENIQSGVALEIRNAAQTAQLGVLSNKISFTMSSIIAFMLKWAYDVELTATDVKFTLSTDFDPVPLGADWLRLATEWYEKGLIPRSLWLQMLKSNDMVDPTYDDEEGVAEINSDTLIVSPAAANDTFSNQLNQER